MEKAIQRLSSGNAPGADSISAAIFASGGHRPTERFTELFQSMWRQERLPQEYKDASIVHLYKRKGNRKACNNYRVISLLSIAGKKPRARILLNRLNTRETCYHRATTVWL